MLQFNHPRDSNASKRLANRIRNYNIDDFENKTEGNKFSELTGLIRSVRVAESVGSLVCDSKRRDGVVTMPYIRYSKLVDDIIDALQAICNRPEYKGTYFWNVFEQYGISNDLEDIEMIDISDKDERAIFALIQRVYAAVSIAF